MDFLFLTILIVRDFFLILDLGLNLITCFFLLKVTLLLDLERLFKLPDLKVLLGFRMPFFATVAFKVLYFLKLFIGFCLIPLFFFLLLDSSSIIDGALSLIPSFDLKGKGLGVIFGPFINFFFFLLEISESSF